MWPNYRKYPNNGFKSYVDFLYNKYKLGKPGANFIERIALTASMIFWKTLKDAGIELFFLAVFWVIIVEMSQGRDLIVSLFEPGGLYGPLRVIYTILATISYSLSMWLIPAFLFQVREDRNPATLSPFKTHLFFIHRVLPMFPFWLLAMALFNEGELTFALISLALLGALYAFNYKVKDPRKHWYLIAFIVACIIINLIYFYAIYKKAYFDAKVALAVLLYLISAAIFLIYQQVDRRILLENQMPTAGSVHRRYPANTALYVSFGVAHIIIVTVIYFRPLHFAIAPESALLYLLSLYVFCIDLFFYFINIHHRTKILATFIAAGVLILLISPFWDLNGSHHYLVANKDSTVIDHRGRDTFEDRYQELRKRIIDNRTGTAYPIVLVSGEGGGSRAGMWFSQLMINFDHETQGKFRDHIFSVSTVSGSSVGLSTVFTYWENTRNAGASDSQWLDLPSKVFESNYVGSSIPAILLTDVVKAFIPFNIPGDRNTLLQDEEAYATAKAVLAVNGKERSIDEIPESELLLKRDFMSFFYEKANGSIRYKQHMPITFVNTCRSDDARRGIFSSIKLSDQYFNDALDINAYLYEDSVCNYKGEKVCSCIKKRISLGQACNTSELFPVFSAPVYIDSLGSFVDGGYHENSGLKTTLDVYTQLKERLKSDTDIKDNMYEVYVVYLKNGKDEKQIYKPLKSRAAIIQPAVAILNQPFEGSQSFFEERTRFTFPDTNFIKLSLKPNMIVETRDSTGKKRPYSIAIEDEILDDLKMDIKNSTDSSLNFPLARWLSRTVVARIREKASSAWYDERLRGMLDHVRQYNGIVGYERAH